MEDKDTTEIGAVVSKPEPVVDNPVAEARKKLGVTLSSLVSVTEIQQKPQSMRALALLKEAVEETDPGKDPSLDLYSIGKEDPKETYHLSDFAPIFSRLDIENPGRNEENRVVENGKIIPMRESAALGHRERVYRLKNMPLAFQLRMVDLRMTTSEPSDPRVDFVQVKGLNVEPHQEETTPLRDLF